MKSGVWCAAGVGWVWLVAGAGVAAEAEPADEPIEVGEVVVSATKTPIPVTQVTSAVEIIKGEEMEQRKIRTVVDALRLSQGTAVFSNGGPGTNATVRIRGASSSQTMVLIDGAIVNSPTSGDFNFANLTADNIDRIEILRGAQSMLYGSDAMGGVINIITKRGAGPLAGSAFIEYGSFATLREGGQVTGGKGPVDFALSLSRWDTSNFSVANYRRGAIERDAFHNWQGSGRLGFTLPKDGRIDVTARWWNSDVMLDNVTTNAQFDVFGSKQTTNTLILSASYEQPLTTWWSQKLTVGQNNERLEFDPGASRRNVQTGAFTTISPRIASDIEILNRRLEWQHNFRIGKPLLLTAGYQYRGEQGENQSFAPATSTDKILISNAGFAEAQVNVQERLLFTAGVRQDSYNTFGDATTYRITGGYRITETGTKFRGSYATGFRAPTINQLYFPGFGNPDLKPEQNRGWDVGIDQSVWRDKLFLSATYYYTDFENLIQNVVAGALLKPENVGEARTQGWEVGFRVDVLPNLSFRGQYTNTSNRNLTNGKRLARVPIDQASLGLSYRPIPALQLNVDYRFVGARNNDANNSPEGKLGAFGVVSATASYDINKTVQVFGRVENLGDAQYEEIIGYGTPIRSIFGGIKLTL